MDFDKLILALPDVESWIDQYINEHREVAVPLVSRKFPRIGSYFSESTLRTAQVVYVPKVVTPPFGELGIDGFADFESGSYEGMTYKDFFFIDSLHQDSESLHFHEMVHIIQWRELGPKNFLLLYAKGLEENSYRDAPLEVMAYRSQQEFDKKTTIPDFEMKIAQMVRHEVQKEGLG